MQVALMGQAEAFRAAGEAPGVEGLDKLYPGERDRILVALIYF